jgi:hypothetical protein
MRVLKADMQYTLRNSNATFLERAENAVNDSFLALLGLLLYVFVGLLFINYSGPYRPKVSTVPTTRMEIPSSKSSPLNLPKAKSEDEKIDLKDKVRRDNEKSIERFQNLN